MTAWHGGSWTGAEERQTWSPEMEDTWGGATYHLQSLGYLCGRPPGGRLVRVLGDGVAPPRDGGRLASGGCDVCIGDMLHPRSVAWRID